MNPSPYASIHAAIIHSYTSTGNYWMQRSHTVHAPTALPPSTPGTEKYAFLFPLAQFFKMLQLMGYEWANNLEHVNYRLALGMSTRKGPVVFLDQIIRETSSVMHEQMRKNEDNKYSAIEDSETVAIEIGIIGIKI